MFRHSNRFDQLAGSVADEYTNVVKKCASHDWSVDWTEWHWCLICVRTSRTHDELYLANIRNVSQFSTEENVYLIFKFYTKFSLIGKLSIKKQDSTGFLMKRGTQDREHLWRQIEAVKGIYYKWYIIGDWE